MKTQLQLLQEFREKFGIDGKWISFPLDTREGYTCDHDDGYFCEHRREVIEQWLSEALTQTHNQTLNEILALPEMEKEDEGVFYPILEAPELAMYRIAKQGKNQLREQLRKSILKLLNHE